MVDPVRRQYETYPYPARDPAKETEHLHIGSPSHPLEIDHFLFAGQRDWTQPTKVLVAGGGTGDALVMMAQIFADWGATVDIHYLDMSEASRKIAEARMATRGLSATFHTGDLLTAPDLGPFDYIDCCGVLHHLPDPQAGASALAQALTPGGGIGAMVYAPHGRSGVYEMQDALRALVPDDEPTEQVAFARSVMARLPESNGLVRNPFVHDHLEAGDAGIYDLLLHSRDRAYDVDALYGLLDGAGLSLVSFATPGRYNPRMVIADKTLRARVDKMSAQAQAALAERLIGNFKTHQFYAVPKGTEDGRIAEISAEAVPNFLNVSATRLAEQIWKDGLIKINVDGAVVNRRLPKETAGVVATIDGKRSLAQIAAALGLQGKAFLEQFDTLYQPLNNFNLLRFSARRGL